MMDFAVISAVFLRTWLKVARRPVILLLSFVQPLIWLLLFGVLFQRFPLGAAPDETSYLAFLLPGVCGMTVLLGGSQSGIGVIRDLQSGMLQRALTTPASRTAMLVGKIAADVSRLGLQATVLALVGLALGCQFHVTPALAAAVTPLALFATAYCCLSCWIALATRSQEGMSAFVHVVNMPIFFTSSALVPAKQMPEWLAPVAAWNPLTLAVDPLRSAMWQGSASGAAQSSALLACLAAATFALALTAFRGRLHDDS